MLHSQTIQHEQLVNLRGGVALVQTLRAPSHHLELALDVGVVNYTLERQISPVFYKYSRLGAHVHQAPQDIYVILPV